MLQEQRERDRFALKGTFSVLKSRAECEAGEEKKPLTPTPGGIFFLPFMTEYFCSHGHLNVSTRPLGGDAPNAREEHSESVSLSVRWNPEKSGKTKSEK